VIAVELPLSRSRRHAIHVATMAMRVPSVIRNACPARFARAAPGSAACTCDQQSHGLGHVAPGRGGADAEPGGQNGEGPTLVELVIALPARRFSLLQAAPPPVISPYPGTPQAHDEKAQYVLQQRCMVIEIEPEAVRCRGGGVTRGLSARSL
jgi:hypothetical protein